LNVQSSRPALQLPAPKFSSFRRKSSHTINQCASSRELKLIATRRVNTNALPTRLRTTQSEKEKASNNKLTIDRGQNRIAGDRQRDPRRKKL
jgi:hypothetical protein